MTKNPVEISTPIFTIRLGKYTLRIEETKTKTVKVIREILDLLEKKEKQVRKL